MRSRLVPSAACRLLGTVLLALSPSGWARGNPRPTPAPDPSASLGPPPAGDRVLFVGNSLTAGNQLPLLVEALSAEGGRPLSTEWVVYGGVGLAAHWMRRTQDRLAAATWRYVVLQQGPSSLLASRVELREWTARFDPVIRRAGGRTALFMVWPESRRRAVFPRVGESYRLAARDVGAVLLPVGDAWLAAWRRKPSLALYGADGFHPTLAGSYLAALTIYARLTGGSPVGLPGRLRLRSGVTVAVDGEDTAVLQAAAAEATGAP